MSQDNKSIIRDAVEDIEGVNRSWFEWELEGHNRTKTLVVEVGFDLDPHSAHFSRTGIDLIEETVAKVLREENSKAISKLKIVNRAPQSAESERRPPKKGADMESAPAPMRA